MGIQSKIKNYIQLWESRCYKNGIPDEAPIQINDKVPSYKKICLSILKNDYKDLGYYPKKSKYYSLLKRMEIEQKKYVGKQLKLKL